jgi:threonine dehydrogenase-like Zn-dependent dehydrogenase
MRAVCWNGTKTVTVEDVPDPEIINESDAIIKVSSTAICGSDLHLYDGFVPTMKRGDILGHEFMGEVVEVGDDVQNLKVGDRVVVPAIISCGKCYYCKKNLWSLCDNSNPKASLAEAANGFSGSGIFGYSHMYGGYAGGQAEYVRVPYADVGPLKVSTGIPDDSVLFLSDIFPTGYMAADYCDIKQGDVIAIWGCGPVGQFAIRSAFMLGAEKVIAIDRFPERLEMARQAGAETINYEENSDVVEKLKALTGGRGPDACIDAVGCEAHSMKIDALSDTAKTMVHLGTDRAHVLREAIKACRKGGTVSVIGVYVGFPDKIPFGAAFAKGLKFKMGQVHIHRYMKPLLEKIENGEIDPSFVITHSLPLEEAGKAYHRFAHKEDKCIKIVLRP